MTPEEQRYVAETIAAMKEEAQQAKEAIIERLLRPKPPNMTAEDYRLWRAKAMTLLRHWPKYD